MSLRQALFDFGVHRMVGALAFLDRQKRRLEQVLSGVVLAGSAPASLRKLVVRAYTDSHPPRDAGLCEWEAQWFGRALPAAPARILVGAAGTGREVAYLDSKGYATVAFDPVGRLVEVARRRPDLSRSLAFLQGGFEGLISPTGDSELAFRGEVERHAPYDAVLLGWCGIIHLPTRRAREDLMIELRRLCPTGPVLLSYWQHEGHVEPSRAWQLGWKLGGWLSGQFAAEQADFSGDLVLQHVGYAHRFTEGEIQELATGAGYAVVESPRNRPEDEHPHATFVPL